VINSDICIYPLLEGKVSASLMGNKIFDYLGNGIPTIYSGPDGDVKSLIDKSKSGFCIKTNDDKSFSELIVDLNFRRKELKKMGEKAKLFIRNHYSLDSSMKNFIKIVNKCLDI
jgi:glycosyltransferase involved in cell wall biosynthesis